MSQFHNRRFGNTSALMSFVRSLKAVAWSFLGIRKQSGFQDDLQRVNPFHIIIAGFLGALVLVFGLIALVNWVVTV